MLAAVASGANMGRRLLMAGAARAEEREMRASRSMGTCRGPIGGFFRNVLCFTRLKYSRESYIQLSTSPLKVSVSKKAASTAYMAV